MNRKVIALIVACVLALIFGSVIGSGALSTSGTVGKGSSSSTHTKTVDNEKNFVGTWKLVSGDGLSQSDIKSLGTIEYTFDSDGTMEMDVNGTIMRGTWKSTGGNEATARYSYQGDSVRINMELDGNEIIVTSSSEEGWLRFRKV